MRGISASTGEKERAVCARDSKTMQHRHNKTQQHFQLHSHYSNQVKGGHKMESGRVTRQRSRELRSIRYLLGKISGAAVQRRAFEKPV